MTASSSSKYFNRYVVATMSYGFARTLVMTSDAVVVERPGIERKMLITERSCAVVASTILGPYLSPFYFVSDMCALEKKGFESEEKVNAKPRFIGIPDAIFHFSY